MAPESAVVKSLHGKFSLEQFSTCVRIPYFVFVLQFSTLTACGKAWNGRSNGLNILEAIDLVKRLICFYALLQFVWKNSVCDWGREKKEQEHPFTSLFNIQLHNRIKYE